MKCNLQISMYNLIIYCRKFLSVQGYVVIALRQVCPSGRGGCSLSIKEREEDGVELECFWEVQVVQGTMYLGNEITRKIEID